MTSIPASVRPVHTQPTHARPAHAAAPAGGGGGAPNIDPIKVLSQNKLTLIVAAFLGAALGLAAHFAWMATYPFYSSTVVFECTTPLTSLTDVVTRTLSDEKELDRFMATQAKIMVADTILTETIRDRRFQETAWAKRFVTGGQLNEADALYWLKDDLSARVVQGTQLINLKMTWKNKQDVYTIADLVREYYTKALDRQFRDRTSEKREALNQRAKRLQDEIDQLTEKKERNMAGVSLDALEANQVSESTRIMTIEPALTKFKADVQEQQVILNRYQEQLNAAERGNAIQYSDDLRGAVYQLPNIQLQMRELTQYKARLGQMIGNSFGEDHKEVRGLRYIIEATQAQLDKTVEDELRKAFFAQIDEARVRLKALDEQVGKLQRDLDEAIAKRQDITLTITRMNDFDDQIEKNREEISKVEGALNELESQADLTAAKRVDTFERGRVPDEVDFPKIYIMIPLGLLLVTGLTAGVVVLRAIVDQRVKGPSDITVIPRVRLLGVIPDATEDPAKPAALETAFRDNPLSATAEAFRTVRAPLVKRMHQAGHKTLLVLGGMPQSGATTVAANLALGCAAAEQKVLFIDANFRRPAVHRVFGVAEGPGLADVLARAMPLSGAIQETSLASLHVLTAGTSANRSIPERLSSQVMTDVLREAAEAYDMVVLDCPPATVSGDGLVLANKVDAVALVTRAMAEKRGLVARLRDQLSDARAEMMGVIVNAVRASSGGYMRGNIQAAHEYHTSSKA